MGHTHDHCCGDQCHSHEHEECCSSHHHHHDSCHEHSHDEECCYTQSFLELADEAWMEVLKDKIKEHIITHDHKIDKLAAIIAEANHERWRKKMENESCNENYKQKLHDLFHSTENKPLPRK